MPRDQLAFWGVRVGTEIAKYAPGGGLLRSFLLGDNEVGQEALLRFYVLHCVVIPAAISGLVALHFWRIRKDGGPARRRPRRFDRAARGAVPRRQQNRLGPELPACGSHAGAQAPG